MIEFARTRGVDTLALLRRVGLEPASLDDTDRRISEVSKERLWQEAAERARDPEFGLHVAQFAAVGVLDVLDYALCYSATLEDALGRIVRFHRVLSDSWAIELKVCGTVAYLRRVVATPERHAVEAFYALLLLRARKVTATQISPRLVRFSHARPADSRPHMALFACPIQFGCAATELVFDAVDLALPAARADSGLVRVLDRHMKDLLDRLPQTDDFVRRVHRVVATALHGGRPTLGSTARAMHASARTVQRRLRDHGTTHRRVVDDVRHRLAERLVAAGRHSLTEIAFLAGFAELSVFRRAFKRWTGTSPSEFRALVR